MHALLLMLIKSLPVCETYRFTVSIRSINCLFAEPDLGMFSMFGPTEAPQKEGAHGPQNVGQQCDIFWTVRASLCMYLFIIWFIHTLNHGVLRHSCGATRQSLKITTVVSLFIYDQPSHSSSSKY